MIRPGPDHLDAGLAPGGLVLHVYDRTGVLLLERTLTTTDDEEASADAETVLAKASGRDICLVVYDGDTGCRFAADEFP